MVHLEEWMSIHEMHQLGISQSQIAQQLGLDRKTVRKYLHSPPGSYGPRPPRPAKLDPYRSYLRERWEQGVHNGHKLFLEIRQRGYPGGYSQLRRLLSTWRAEGRERAFVRFETHPGEQSQLDWAHFGNFLSRRLYLFALTLAYSRMRYIEFTQRQDIETLLTCLVHAFHVHSTTREVPCERLLRENLRSTTAQPDYDTSYVAYREVAKDCLLSYPGNRYSVPHAYAGKRVVVKEVLEGGRIVICHQQERIAEHPLGAGKGAMVIEPEHYRGLLRRARGRPPKAGPLRQELVAGPGVGRHFLCRKWRFGHWRSMRR